MTGEELVEGLRERGYFIQRMQQPPWVIIPRIDGDDPLFDWLQNDLACPMSPYKPEAHSNPRAVTYECRLHRAAVEVPGDLVGAKLAEAQALSVWHAAAPVQA